MWSLIEGLPEDAAVWRPDTHRWTQAQELAAQQIEIVDAWGRILYQTLYGVHTGKKPKWMPPPLELDHPGRRIARQKERQPVERDPTKISQFFSRLAR